MSFLRRGKKRKRPASEVEITPPVKHPKKRKITPVEVKLLAIDALKAGIPSSEVCELIGVSNSALGKWRKLYQEGGEGALARQATKVCDSPSYTAHFNCRVLRSTGDRAGVFRGATL